MLTAWIVRGWAQTHLGTAFRLQYADMAVLESRQPRADFSCQVTPQKPGLGFDLHFHADYRVSVPIEVLVGFGGWVQVATRVTPVAHSENPVYLGRWYALPDVPLGVKGQAMLAGGFDLGLGRYRVDWMMRDRSGRVCSSHWELEAKLGRGQRNLLLTVEPNMVAERVDGPFGDEPPVEPASGQPLHVKVLLNLSPTKPEDIILKPEDAGVLLSVLRSITREPRVGRITLVAFNLREQKIVYRQDRAEQIDFAALGKALKAPGAGTIDYRLLKDRQSETHFVTRLLTDQLGARAVSPDAIIIVGPKVTLEKKVPLESLREGGSAPCPIFYLNYNPNPIDQPFRDTIGSALKAYKKAFAYNIALPRDLGTAMRDMMSRIGKRQDSETEIGSLLGARNGAAFQQ